MNKDVKNDFIILLYYMMCSKKQKLDILPTESQSDSSLSENQIVMNILPDQKLTTIDEILEKADFIVKDCVNKLTNLFDIFIEQYPNEQEKINATNIIQENYINKIFDNWYFELNSAYNYITEDIKDVIHEENVEWLKQEKKCNEIKNNLVENINGTQKRELEIHNNNMKESMFISEQRKNDIELIRNIDESLYLKMEKDYKVKHHEYCDIANKKMEQIKNITKEIVSLELQINNVKKCKLLLENELNLVDIRIANNQLKKLFKKVCYYHCQINILRREHRAHLIIASSFPC